jgi:hypothetical protein
MEALINLWRSLGHPKDGFWPALLLDYNCIDASYIRDVTMPNVPSSATDGKVGVERKEDKP